MHADYAASSLIAVDENRLIPFCRSQRLFNITRCGTAHCKTTSRRIVLIFKPLELFFFQDVNCLIDWYLEPLKAETFLSVEDIERLFGNIQEIVQFQKQFLHSLEQAVEQDTPPTGDAMGSDAAKFKVDLRPS
jgi:hypothetical protein